MSTLPESVRYAVEKMTGVVHLPYADHARHLPRTSLRGVGSYTTEPVPCPECWPDLVKPGYQCDRCGRRHLPGSAIYERHRGDVEPGGDDDRAGAQR